MYEALRNRALTLLKVPPEPHPPMGDPKSLRVFRAGRNYYRLKVIGWLVTQVIALAAILFWAGMLYQVERLAQAEQAAANQPATPGATNLVPANDKAVIVPAGKRRRPRRIEQWKLDFERNVTAAANQAGNRSSVAKAWAAAKRVCVEVAIIMPRWVFPIVWLLKIVGLLFYFVQFAISYAVMRLDYEMRWYLVTDRSLRLRHGVWVVWESTMSFANVQQVVVYQGPVQRLLGLANVKVQSAGGGGGGDERGHHREDMHVGYFHSVTNAEEIRDLILERLRRFRESGLGDPEEKPVAMAAAGAGEDGRAETRVPTPLAGARGDEALAAARELAAEARALRAAMGAG